MKGRLELHQRGVSTLVVVLVLFVVMALSAAYANRNQLVEQRIATTALDHMLATDAAQHGADRVLALLNADAIDDQCQPTRAPSKSLRERWLRVNDEGHWQTTAPADPLPLVCDRNLDGHWACQCPAVGAPALVTVGERRGLSVRVGFETSARTPGALGIQAHGCAQASSACHQASSTGSADDISVPRQLQVALLPAIRQVPTATLTALGSVNLGDGMRVAHADGADGGLVLLSGGAVSGETAHLIGPGGSPAAPLVQDAALAALGPEALLRRTFGMSRSALPRHPSLRTLLCSGDCVPALKALLDQGAHFIRVPGEMTLRSAVHLNTAARPIVLIVEGELHWQAAAQLHGLVFVLGDAHLNAPSPAQLTGALVVGGRVHGQSGMALVHDAPLIQHLTHTAGSFVRLSGGQWSPAP